MTSIYFSGTGNTKFCAESFLSEMGGGAAVSIENPAALNTAAGDNDLLLAYPVYFSDIPIIMRDFLTAHKSFFAGKNVFILCTMTAFSGDGAGCGARFLRDCGANIIGGLHIIMPDCIADIKLFKKDEAAQKLIIEKAEAKIAAAVKNYKNGKPPKNGMSFINMLGGLLIQRIWCRRMIDNYAENLKIDSEKCIGCEICVKCCPMKNIETKDEKAFAKNRCTRCYRCINKCPKQAITLTGKAVVAQKKVEV
ncbi:MAG: EFR1 family ferrodoxin [Ruminococcus sp.]|jgi:NAD-dependent dihydropyrimidine dehydrogenase PreA subunit/flavodoxin|nr:EFR1 family ferrodoxin [Ruminococcus sp.]